MLFYVDIEQLFKYGILSEGMNIINETQTSTTHTRTYTIKLL